MLEVDSTNVKLHDVPSPISYFGLREHTWGIIFLLLGSLFNAVDSICFDVAGDEGVSSTTITLSGYIGAFSIAILLDIAGYIQGYQNGKAHVCNNYLNPFHSFPFLV